MAEEGRTDQTAIAPGPDLELSHQVRLDAFSGPLDLLLYLVRRAEVDIAEIPISDIADQFVIAIGGWAQATADDDLDLESAGDFILMAATLLEIKSRMVAPPPENPEASDAEGDEEIIDPRSGLIRQLLAYRRCKEAAQGLVELERAQMERCTRQLRELIPDDPDEIDGLDLDNCDVGALYALWETVLIRINGLGPRTVINDDIPIESHIASLIHSLRSAGEARLQWLFQAEPSRIRRVGILMATLECARQRFVEALQHEQYGEVFLRYRPDAERTARSLEPPEVHGEPLEEDQRKRRRKPPLMTVRVAPGAEDVDDGEAPEEVVETDEQRFLRELEQSCAVEAVTERVADIEASFAAFLAAKRGAADAPPPEPAPVPEP
jgi:segregation and condensation protein A